MRNVHRPAAALPLLQLHQRPHDPLQLDKVRADVLQVLRLLAVEYLEEVTELRRLKGVPGDVGVVVLLQDNVHGAVEQRVKLELQDQRPLLVGQALQTVLVAARSGARRQKVADCLLEAIRRLCFQCFGFCE